MYQLEVKELNCLVRTLISKSDAVEYFTKYDNVFCAYDYETGADDPADAVLYDRAYIIGTSFCYNRKEAVYVPFQHREGNAEPDCIDTVVEFMRSTPLAAFNFPFEYSFTKYHLNFIPKMFVDLQYLAQIDNNNHPDSLKELILKIYGYHMQTFEEVTRNTKDFRNVSVKDGFFYGSSDSLWTLIGIEDMLPRVEADSGKKQILKIENMLLPEICEMHYNGIRYNRQLLLEHVPFMKNVCEEIKQDLMSRIEQECPQFFTPNLYGKSFNLNLNSPADMQKLFKALGYDLSETGTGKKILANIDHPVAKLITKYREEAVILNNYLNAPLTMMNKNDIVFPAIKQLGAPTGRMACFKPNFMALPKLRD